jgi:tetratricopeptide (TPR) repeat protein
MIKLGVELHDWKVAESGAQEMAEQAQGDKSVALAHYEFAIVLIDEGLDKHKDEPFARAHEELTKALAAAPKFPSAVFADGRTLAHLKQDDAAKARFEEFVKMQPEDNPERKRALRYIDEPFWRAPEWLQHSPSRPPTASGFRWTISPERSC